VRSRRQTLGYGAVALLLLLLLLLTVFSGPGGRRAVLISAIVTLMVQAVAFTLARLAAPGNVLKAWGAGTVLRLVALLVYALLLVRPLGLPALPALMSLVSLFFVTTVLESLLLTS
jgi:hypothetical protein